MLNKGIPISISLNPSLQRESITSKQKYNKNRVLRLSLYAIIVAICISFIAKILVDLINLITSFSFYGYFTTEHIAPTNDVFGWFVIFIPAIGGGIVGLMALYGSKAIRGHGIPEAMEQILTNQSKIKPSITFLKPLSSAISIGTGGPFGAEGPIIATGGALGSTLGQILQITPNERKILLASGATAGMAAIFSAPVASILLAIELLLFEFSARSFIPVALACVTGAAGHHLLFGNEVVFPMTMNLGAVQNSALLFYSIMGIAMGLVAIATTKIVYWIEDMFEKIPIHWAFYPAIGGLVVGIVGFYEPKTFGVGYDNITDILSGSLPIQIVASLCALKFISWAIALGSGTSGGTLAPLLTIGGGIGLLFGSVGIYWFPEAGISLPLSALVGISAMFAGTSRAFLTSIVFALETTGQENALLPLLATCTSAYFVSYFLMNNTIMTEKIARRGVYTPSSYEPDILEKTKVKQVANESGIVISSDMKIEEVRSWLEQETDLRSNYFIIADGDGEYIGLLSSTSLFSSHQDADKEVGELVKRKNLSISPEDTLKLAVETMAKENVDLLPIIQDKEILGILTHQNVLSIYKEGINDNENKQSHISLSKQGMKILVQGQKLISIMKIKK